MFCPRCHIELVVEHHRSIEVDRCPTCNGRWLDHHEIDLLEDTAYDASRPKGTRVYALREGELDCPRCSERMRAFNYRAHNLEIDFCEQEHGFWLDAGEEGKVRDIMAERVRGLDRAASAEDAWGHFLAGLSAKGLRNRLRGRGKRR